MHFTGTLMVFNSGYFRYNSGAVGGRVEGFGVFGLVTTATSYHSRRFGRLKYGFLVSVPV